MLLNTPTLRNLTSNNFGKPPVKQNPLLAQLGQPHLDSFNYMVNSGLDHAVANLYPVEFELQTKDKVCLKIEDISLGYPAAPLGVIGIKNQNVYPTECKQRGVTYRGRLCIRVSWSINGKLQVAFDKDLGDIPIMIKSNRCHLAHMKPSQLVEHGEHEQEWGGYFIIKGLERLVRMLLMTRRNYPITIKRSNWKMRGSLFSEYGVLIRCVMSDQTSTNNVLHFVTDGSVKLMFSYRKVLYYAPLILIMKTLCDYTDYYIYKKLMEGCESDLYYSDCIQNMLRSTHSEGLHTHQLCKDFIGKMFRVKFYECPGWWTDSEVADFILEKTVLIHLSSPRDKFNMLVFMTKKLFSFAQDKCKIEGADAVMMQELLLGGHLYLQVLKEKLQGWLLSVKQNLLRKCNSKSNFSLSQQEMLLAAKQAGTLENALEMFFATGNLVSNSGLGLMQDKGLTIVPENINRMRYMSHFKAVHRGAFFQEMRTTEARQLLPDAWGFICPVHTPDGAPCGLLNHLTMNCIVTDIVPKDILNNIPLILADLGMIPYDDSDNIKCDFKNCYTTILDGKILGYTPIDTITLFMDKLRLLKVKGDKIPRTLEIALVPLKRTKGQYPGLYLFSGPARMMRPLLNLQINEIELIGTFEQVYLDVCVSPAEFYKGVTTHMELSKTAFMSNLAHLIPMPDCNQSPRNMYQCQMGKQTMGSACHNWDIQAETKLYRLQTPASPFFRPVHYDNIGLDDFAMGTNAIVAVISYTGYDMEDAMIINKCSEERGLAHGSIYKSEFIELDQPNSYFCRDPSQEQLVDKLDTDGLPYIGRKIIEGEPLYCHYSTDESRYIIGKCKSKEECYVSSVRLCSDFNSKKPKIVCITYRVQRNPCVGDKFASRAGQKGICSQKWAAEDLPFTETGMVPDIVFNPHGFPSRMTIAMMIEVMAGKSAAIHGLVHDATPFKFNEEKTAIDYFGQLLQIGGYNYYGTETMYSGVDGREMEAQIFFGVVHYQRLRHMVSDKWQVRSTGPTDILTRQPLKGRKRGGGVRFGEMERDSLISHGASFLLQDRLFHCSDSSTAFICTKCNSLLGPVTVVTRMADNRNLTETRETCRLCGSGDNVSLIQIPYIFKFLITQLASCNINVKIKCKET
ncbi:dna-directed rna polymerase i subunit 2 [Holotrichia oblita]|uniref:Dna-directed rna polymerase i subunit 2 n=1 Tax=Holotrichia oblita TaxID=644536 RepID=A0ACB9SN49_HOLOL|nr:dna-directed rna polymerase i subunit 2 [Holotrichia oblita]